MATHLTLTGFEAGRVICGSPKDPSQHQYLHYMYAPIDRLKRNEIPGFGPLCSACMAEVEASEPESDMERDRR